MDDDRPGEAGRGHGPRPTYPIESVDNALKLLGMFRKRQLVRVSEAGDALGIARSTAHRLLARPCSISGWRRSRASTFACWHGRSSSA